MGNLLTGWPGLGSVQGEVAALSAAFVWALATVLFGLLGKRLPPLLLNLVKGLIALGLLGITLVIRGQPPVAIDLGPLLILLLSGVVGIGLGDTAYFTAVNTLGPRRALLMESLAPPLAALLAGFALQELLPVRAWLGIGLTVAGVAWVISERLPVAAGMEATRAPHWRSVSWGALSALGQATGAVMSRSVLVDTGVDPLWSSFLRLLGGLIVLLPLLARQGWPQLRPQIQQLRSQRLLAGVAIAAFLGTYLGIWLQQTAFKYTETGIAQSLTATSPLFVLPMVALLGERISPRAILGVSLSIFGIVLLFWRGG